MSTSDVARQALFFLIRGELLCQDAASAARTLVDRRQASCGTVHRSAGESGVS